MPKEGAPTDSAAHDPIAPQEQGPETDLFTREAEAKRAIHGSAAAIMERLRPGQPFKAILDVQRNETPRGSQNEYSAVPVGSLRLLTPFNRADEGVAEKMWHAVLLDETSRPTGQVDEAGEVRALEEGFSYFVKFNRDGVLAEKPGTKEGLSNLSAYSDHFVGLEFALLGDPVHQYDPSRTDERVVVIQETLARALGEVTGRLEAAQVPQEPSPQP